MLIPFDRSGEFCPSASGRAGELQRLAVRGAGATLLSGGFMLAVQIVSTYVLARLLAPSDFGLVAMVTTFSMLLMNFGMNGLTEAVVQRQTVNHRLASNLFWINVSGSFALTIGFAASGPLLVRFFRDPRILHITYAMALTIVLTGVSVLHLALLKRAMRFAAVSANDSIGRLISVAAGIALAWAGYGYWALVGAALALPISIGVGAWSMCRWLPGPPHLRAGTRPVVKFAMNAYARYSTGYLANNLDNLLIGWRLGAASLGFYKKAYDLFILPAGQLSTGMTGVAVSALSRLQNDPVRLRQSILKALGIMALLGMALGANLTLVGSDLLLLLLGPKWNLSGRLFTLFGPGIGIMLLYFTHVWVHLSIGRADRWFRWGLVDLFVTFIALLVGLHWGAPGIAMAWVTSYWIITLPALWYACAPIDLSAQAIIASVWRPMLASLLAGVATWALQYGMLLHSSLSFTAPLSRIFIASGLFCALYFAAITLLYGGIRPFQDVAALLREFRRREAPPDPGKESELATYAGSCEG